MADDDTFDESFVQVADLERDEDGATEAARRTLEQAELELMAAWVAGDRSAGNQLVRTYLKPITRFFQAKVHDTNRVEHLVSDFLEQLTKAPKKVHTTVKAYIFGIAKYTLLHHFRSQRRRWKLTRNEHATWIARRRNGLGCSVAARRIGTAHRARLSHRAR